jgi:hypothetical protein
MRWSSHFFSFSFSFRSRSDVRSQSRSSRGNGNKNLVLALPVREFRGCRESMVPPATSPRTYRNLPNLPPQEAKHSFDDSSLLQAEKVRRISLLSLRSEVGHTMALTKGSLLKVASRYSGTYNNQRSFQSRAADSEVIPPSGSLFGSPET